MTSPKFTVTKSSKFFKIPSPFELTWLNYVYFVDSDPRYFVPSLNGSGHQFGEVVANVN